MIVTAPRSQLHSLWRPATVEGVMIDSKGFSPVRCRLKPNISQSVAAAGLAPTDSPKAASAMSKAPRSLASLRDRALDVIGSDEFFLVAFVPACMSKSQASLEDLTRRGNLTANRPQQSAKLPKQISSSI